METFVLVIFWMHLVATVANVITLATTDYPRRRPTESIGYAVATTLITMLIGIWAAHIIWVGG